MRRAVGEAALGPQQAEGKEQRAKQERTRQWLHSQAAQTDSDSERQVRQPALTVNTHLLALYMYAKTVKRSILLIVINRGFVKCFFPEIGQRGRLQVSKRDKKPGSQRTRSEPPTGSHQTHISLRRSTRASAQRLFATTQSNFFFFIKLNFTSFTLT